MDAAVEQTNKAGGEIATHLCDMKDRASVEARFITETEIVVDGGMTARCE